MTAEFRRQAKKNLSSLLEYWRTIEYWLKRAEQINGKAVIPAINELRYASRQLFNALRIYGKARLGDGDTSVLSKRMILAEQYLLNADHDIGDAITTFYAEELSVAEKTIGKDALVRYFPQFVEFKKLVETCEALVLEARHDYNVRAVNYQKIRDIHTQKLQDFFGEFVDAQVFATQEKEERVAELIRAKAKINILVWFAIFTGMASVVGVILSVVFWIYPPSAFCQGHAADFLAGICAPHLHAFR